MDDTYGDTVPNSVGGVRQHPQRMQHFREALTSVSMLAQLRRQGWLASSKPDLEL